MMKPEVCPRARSRSRRARLARFRRRWPASLTVAAASAAAAPATHPLPQGGRALGGCGRQPDYATWSNAERAGAAAATTRRCGGRWAGRGGRGQLPVPRIRRAIRPTVQYPGSAATALGEAWRQCAAASILPYGGSLVLIALPWRWRSSTPPKGPLGTRRDRGAGSESASAPFQAPRRTGAQQRRCCCWRCRGCCWRFRPYVLRPVVGAIFAPSTASRDAAGGPVRRARTA